MQCRVTSQGTSEAGAFQALSRGRGFTVPSDPLGRYGNACRTQTLPAGCKCLSTAAHKPRAVCVKGKVYSQEGGRRAGLTFNLQDFLLSNPGHQIASAPSLLTVLAELLLDLLEIRASHDPDFHLLAQPLQELGHLSRDFLDAKTKPFGLSAPCSAR